MTTGQFIALTSQAFAGKAMSLLFNMLFVFVITFLPRSECLLISQLQPPSEVTLEPKKRKYVATSTFPFLFAVKAGTGCHDLSFQNVEL